MQAQSKSVFYALGASLSPFSCLYSYLQAPMSIPMALTDVDTYTRLWVGVGSIGQHGLTERCVPACTNRSITRGEENEAIRLFVYGRSCLNISPIPHSGDRVCVKEGIHVMELMQLGMRPCSHGTLHPANLGMSFFVNLLFSDNLWICFNVPLKKSLRLLKTVKHIARSRQFFNDRS